MAKKIDKEKLKNLKSYNYNMYKFSEFDFTILHSIGSVKRAGQTKQIQNFNNVLIMADTETSKQCYDEIKENYVVAWTITLLSIEISKPLFTIYGNKSSDLISTLYSIHNEMSANNTIIYFHNLAYDWVFIRKFCFSSWGFPEKELATKPQFPISIEFSNGIKFRDSLILAQRSLDKWSKDLNVEHQKAIGKWDYDKIRSQNEVFSSDELEYIEHDTLAGVECLYSTMKMLHKHAYSLPMTATGIPREEVRKRGKQNRAKDRFNKMVVDFELYKKLLMVFHGGYTHANRHYVNWVIGSKDNPVIAYDFTSSYPYVMLSEKFPMGKFTKCENEYSIDDILNNSEDTAFLFKLCLVNVRLKSDDISMPALQFSKCITSMNEIIDNGRILCASYIEIYINENDLSVIQEQYSYDKHLCTDVYLAAKNYLPRWFTDYVYQLFKDKTTEKNGDPVLYSLLKSKLNSLYGMTVQKSIRDDIQEDYDTGEYTITNQMNADEYQKYVDNFNNILPYQWGVWVTSYAFKNLHELGKCAEIWLYSDTDSCYGQNWNEKKLHEYNQKAKAKLRSNGYGAVLYNGKAYWLGEASLDGIYSEFIAQGAKRYACRKLKDDSIKITVAGVPKNGAIELKNDLHNFKAGLIFRGSVTGKKTHSIFINDIHYINNDIEVGDSIDLSPCDYLLDSIKVEDWETLFYDEYEVVEYETDKYIF